MQNFKYVKGVTLNQAVSALGETAKVIAGGTDLIGVMKDDIHPVYPETLVDIKSIPGLDYIKEEDGMLKIGALTRLADIAENATVKSKYEALAKAALKVATPQIREMGTLGGNLCQEVRCWYYRNPDNRFDCLRKGGKECFALTGDARYHSIFGSIRVSRTPCSAECPANTNIPDYMDRIREGDMAGAARIILEDDPMPAITGRVCPHRCESKCNRVGYDEAVSIRSVERYAGDYILNNPGIMGKPAKAVGKKVAIVGSGPAGLSAAYFLAKKGYSVTIYEAASIAGGMMSLGIPEHRLPRKVVNQEIDAIKKIGVEIKLNTPIGKGATTIDNLKKNYDAVFIATGLQNSMKLNVPGENNTSVLQAMSFLKDVNSGKKIAMGKKVVVIGGGSVAIDVATVAVRLGVSDVTITCLECSHDEMPAQNDEIQQAIEEGIKIDMSWGPKEIITSGGKVKGIELKRCTTCYDKSGKFAPTYNDKETKKIDADMVIVAIGQSSDLSFLPATSKINTTRRGTLEIDADSMVTSIDGVFAGGDIRRGAGILVEALADGKKAAENIDIYLSGKKKKTNKSPSLKPLQKFNSAYMGKTTRVDAPKLTVSERVSRIDAEDIGSLEPSAVLAEANRCFNCACAALNASDMAPALIALSADIKTTKRVIPAEKFFTVDEDTTTVLADDEIITEIQVPKPAPGTKFTFRKFSIRKSIDFAMVSVATAITTSGRKVSDARIVLSAVAPIPYRAIEAENVLKGNTLDTALAEKAAAAAIKNTVPLSNNKYKVQIAKTLVKRAILGLPE